MFKSKLIIYNSNTLFDILYEIREKINYNLIKISKIEELNNIIDVEDNNYLLISDKKIKKLIKINHLIIKNKPFKITSLLEKINISLLKNNYSGQSNLKINNYSLNINSRELIKNERSLKLTQKEVEVIVYLNNSDKSMPITSLQKEVWGHNSSLETHTVETHIYRLRRKISQKFGDNQFIKSVNDGYKIYKEKKYNSKKFIH